MHPNAERTFIGELAMAQQDINTNIANMANMAIESAVTDSKSCSPSVKM
jgi:hypothetical protein